MAAWHTVRTGDSLVGLTTTAGFGSVDAIWDHPDNAALREKRGDPWLLMPGDRIFIPDPEPGSRAVRSGRRHVFVRRLPRARICVQILYADGTRAARHRYAIDLEQEHHEGVTNDDGVVERAVPAAARQGKLTVWMLENDAEVPRAWDLDLGHLEPVRNVGGVQDRLRNAGLYFGARHGELDPLTREAIQAFQELQGIEPTGEPDDPTCEALEAFYGM